MKNDNWKKEKFRSSYGFENKGVNKERDDSPLRRTPNLRDVGATVFIYVMPDRRSGAGRVVQITGSSVSGRSYCGRWSRVKVAEDMKRDDKTEKDKYGYESLAIH